MKPGSKYYDWEIKGVPLRLEIGPKDLAKGSVMSRRRGAERAAKRDISADDLVAGVKEELRRVEEEIKERSARHLDASVRPLPSLAIDSIFPQVGEKIAFEEPIEEGLVYAFPFDGDEKMAEMIEEETQMTFLGYSLDAYDSERTCSFTGRPTCNKAILARTYS